MGMYAMIQPGMILARYHKWLTRKKLLFVLPAGTGPVNSDMVDKAKELGYRWDGMKEVKVYASTINPYWQKPLGTCSLCMLSTFGSAAYWVTSPILMDGYSLLQLAILWPVVIISGVFACSAMMRSIQ
jgi:hypothetical protein